MSLNSPCFDTGSLPSLCVGLVQKRLRDRLSKRPTLEKKPLIEIMADLVEPTKTVVVSATRFPNVRSASSKYCAIFQWKIPLPFCIVHSAVLLVS